MNKKKILLYAHYYYPDVASTGQLLTELAEELATEFEVTVICVVPSYSGKIDLAYKQEKYFYEKINGVSIIRVRVPEFTKTEKVSRIKNILAYFFGAIIATIRLPKQDIVFTISQPPILGGLLGVIGKFLKKGKLIYNIQDFNPEQTRAVKYSKNTVVLNFAQSLDKLSTKYADQVVLVGRDMVGTLQERFKDENTPSYVLINNWIDEQTVIPLPDTHPRVVAFKQHYHLENKFIISYSGNIGLYYDLENIMSIIKKFNDNESIRFVFIGEGTVKEKLQDIVEKEQLTNVRFIPYQDKENLVYSLNAADAHWVVNAKGVKGISVPSKVYGVMAVGKPILGILEKESEARIIIEQADCGYVVEPGDYQAVENMLRAILQNKAAFKEKGIKGRLYLEKHFSKDTSIKKYKIMIDELIQNKSLLDKGGRE